MRSGFERTLAAQLKKAKVKFGYETLKLPYSIEHNYNPDFILSNGVIIEAKGRFLNGDARKMLAVKSAHPHLDIRFVFYNAHQKVTGRRYTYAEWADKNDFPWAHQEIPESWYSDE